MEVYIMSYDTKFKLRVVDNILQGISWNEVIKLFKISSNTIGRWVKEYKENGGFVEKKRKTHEARKIDPETLKIEIEKNPDATLKELSEKFDCWPPAIHYRCQKLGITRKKKHIIHREK